MNRAAVLIGVANPGGLQPLQAVGKCLQQMRDWADANQHISCVEVLSDEAGPVTADAVKKTIKKIVDSNTVEQLIVYFAGHGVNIRYGEYWLLSDAPVDTQAAVNVDGSVVLARQSGIPHVVLISDACRTAAEGIQAQYVTGSEIFPNTGDAGTEDCVDLFFASTLGKPALEVRDPTDAAKAYRAIYTDTLVEALRGKVEPPLEHIDDGRGLVRPWPLKRYLRQAVSKRLMDAKVNPTITQTPDARITSDEKAWIAEILSKTPTLSVPMPSAAAPISRVFNPLDALFGGIAGVAVGAAASVGGALRSVKNAIVPRKEPPLTASDAADAMLREGLAGNAPEFVAPNVQSGGLLNAGLARNAQTFGPDHFETQCGFKINGKALAAAWSRGHVAQQLSPELIRVAAGSWPAQNVLLEFTDGTGVVLPAIPEFIATLVFDREGELENVAYEPSANTWRWDEFSRRKENVRRLRSIIAASARLGVFHLERDDAPALAREMQFSKGVDPTMAIYAAYAYHDLQERGRISEMQGYLRDGLGMTFFDLALLSRTRVDSLDAQHHVFPSYPILAQGWALLNAFGVRVPAPLLGIDRHVLPSLWTTFDAGGVSQLRDAVMKGEVL